MTGILLLAVNDLRNGYLAVGGQTAVGRGVFAPDTSEEYPKGVIFIDGKPRLETNSSRKHSIVSAHIRGEKHGSDKYPGTGNTICVIP